MALKMNWAQFIEGNIWYQIISNPFAKIFAVTFCTGWYLKSHCNPLQVLNHSLDYVGVAFCACGMEGCPGVFIYSVYIGAIADKQTNCSQVAIQRRLVERGHTWNNDGTVLNAVHIIHFSHLAWDTKLLIFRWRHQMETFSSSLTSCVGNSPFTGEFPSQKPGMRSFDVFFGLHSWVNNRMAGELKRHHTHYDVTLMFTNTAILRKGHIHLRVVVYRTRPWFGVTFWGL